MRVTFHRELLGHAFRQAGVDGGVLGGEFAHDPFALCFGVYGCCLCGSEQIVEFGDEFLHGGDELNETFGNEHRAEVVAGGSALGHHFSDVGHDVVERHVLLFHFFAHDADIGLALQGAFQSDMAGGAAHELDEVPVFAGGVGVALDVADDLCISLAGRVETEARLDLFVLQVAVDGLGAADDLYAVLLGGIIFGQDAGIRVGVVAADDNDGLDAQFADDLQTGLELILLLQLRTAGTDHVETARVAIFVDDFGCQLYVLVVYQTAGAHEEAVELVLGALLLEFVEEAADNIVAAGSLTAGEDDADVHRLVSTLLVRRNELHEGHTIGIGEESLYFFLIAYALRGSTFFNTYVAAQAQRKFGLVSGACNL